ncbi:GntR family transcriptional regulator [Nocardioides lijunqiniae]|uniref:GntR family transcriptional regulator n=1 Tax=Nocardioides lijunqiniae TaxID=2760832 RepID=UPI0018777509|nr:GntR family transcriptional regulator [Nocardioides lijunqiniae]
MPVPATTPPPRTLLRERVFTTLRTAIVDGTLEPGERLVDAELCSWLGVSRTPVREALSRLEQIGLVQVRPGSSTIVSPLDVRAAVEAQVVAASLHELAAREAVPLLKEPDLARMEAANDAFADALRRADVEAAIAADDDFHGVLVELCANRTVISVLDDVTPLLRRMERVRFATLAGRASVAQHRTIVEHARRGDAEAAARETRANWLTLVPPAG